VTGGTRGASRVIERAIAAGLCLLIFVLAVVNAGIGGRDRLTLIVLAVAGTVVLWIVSRRYRGGDGPLPPRTPRPRRRGAR
jgi:hypothetical protein